jgi:hypothetical protein
MPPPRWLLRPLALCPGLRAAWRAPRTFSPRAPRNFLLWRRLLSRLLHASGFLCLSTPPARPRFSRPCDACAQAPATAADVTFVAPPGTSPGIPAPPTLTLCCQRPACSSPTVATVYCDLPLKFSLSAPPRALLLPSSVARPATRCALASACLLLAPGLLALSSPPRWFGLGLLCLLPRARFAPTLPLLLAIARGLCPPRPAGFLAIPLALLLKTLTSKSKPF